MMPGMTAGGSFIVAKRDPGREGWNMNMKQSEGGNKKVYSRIGGCLAGDGDVAIERRTAGTRQACSNAKRHGRQSCGEFLELHDASEGGCSWRVRND